METRGPADEVLSFKMTSNKNVLIQITAPRDPDSSNFPNIEIQQEGVKEIINFVQGKYFAYIEKNKPADVRLISNNQSQPKKLNIIQTETLTITFSDVRLNRTCFDPFLPKPLKPPQTVPFNFAFCEVPDKQDPSSLNGLLETNQSGIMIYIFVQI